MQKTNIITNRAILFLSTLLLIVSVGCSNQSPDSYAQNSAINWETQLEGVNKRFTKLNSKISEGEQDRLQIKKEVALLRNEVRAIPSKSTDLDIVGKNAKPFEYKFVNSDNLMAVSEDYEQSRLEELEDKVKENTEAIKELRGNTKFGSIAPTTSFPVVTSFPTVTYSGGSNGNLPNLSSTWGMSSTQSFGSNGGFSSYSTPATSTYRAPAPMPVVSTYSYEVPTSFAPTYSTPVVQVPFRQAPARQTAPLRAAVNAYRTTRRFNSVPQNNQPTTCRIVNGQRVCN